jgi:hypothetical protein
MASAARPAVAVRAGAAALATAQVMVGQAPESERVEAAPAQAVPAAPVEVRVPAELAQVLAAQAPPIDGLCKSGRQRSTHQRELQRYWPRRSVQ